MKRIGVIDYGAGNLGSVMNAFKRLALPARFVAGPDDLSSFDRLVFPGDGHFASAMSALERSGYAEAIVAWARQDRPFLGICIGLQLLFDSSEEAPGVRGLAIAPGVARRFPGHKVPQIGWNQTKAAPGSVLFQGIADNTFFYYIHSYYVAPLDEACVSATAEYYVPYCCAVECGAVAAVQFHPEKSGAAGLRLLQNWAEA